MPWVITNNSFFIKSDNRNHTKLYHRNDFGPKQSGPVAGYHDQHVNYATLQEYLGYIIDHDYFDRSSQSNAHKKLCKCPARD